MSNHGAVARRSIEGRYAGAAGADSLRERSLRIELELNFATEHELLEKLIFSHVGSHHFAHLLRLKQKSDAEIRRTRIIGDDGKVLRARSLDRSNQIFGNATDAEAAHHDGGALMNAADRYVRISNCLVHPL